jgi:hypothetical protein
MTHEELEHQIVSLRQSLRREQERSSFLEQRLRMVEEDRRQTYRLAAWGGQRVTIAREK